MATTVAEMAQALGVTENQLKAFVSRGMLLAQRDELDSKISVIRQDRDKANQEAEAQINELTAVKTDLQKQIDQL
jgi:hypothetical protein